LSIPTMFALSFFGIIHVPINVPALGIAVKQDDVNVNRELFGHGLSNALSGMVGSVQVRCKSQLSMTRAMHAKINWLRTISYSQTVVSSSRTGATTEYLGCYLPWPPRAFG
jgi:hypothetical protein